ncbi:MAG: Lrp/AsnC family transcriptional regulator [Burkholderiales bacterium]|jgi:DNA-binding Lrp family transcriptional regulator|nr:Lrp/AsnC family transcriptional regulator [Burkholderiales bacterium]
MSDFTFQLLNDFQRDFPLVPAPFHAIGDQLGLRAEEVIRSLRTLMKQGLISRIGAVLRPNRVGVSTLAALSVPPQALEEVAAVISALPQVNHNYEREHHFNLWFVVTAADSAGLDQVFADIVRKTGLAPLRLPLEREYHIDLGFDLRARVATSHGESLPEAAPPAPLDAGDYALIGAIQDGLPLLPRPFAHIAHHIGMAESEVLSRLQRLKAAGVIKRFGVVVRHHELGFQANAMAVWDVPDGVVDHVGTGVGGSGLVNLCYRRPRRLPDWRYNLFCMIHGRDRDAVAQRLAELNQRWGLTAYPQAVLFSRRRFKQTGARYVHRDSAARMA